MGEKLDDCSNFVTKTISYIPKKESLISERSSELDYFVRSLEEERRKVLAFKRELPLCMQLLKDGIEKMKEEKLQCVERETGLEVAERNYDGRAKMSVDFDDKKNWLSSVQLCSSPVEYKDAPNEESFLSLKYNVKNMGGGAFSPFKKPTVALGHEVDSTTNRGVARPRPHRKQPERKPRRCWSPDLHRIFVDALDHLGGAEVATPKQIREQMKVDGLTNSEVKSHLQKYRIYMRRVPSAAPGPTGLQWLEHRDKFN